MEPERLKRDVIVVIISVGDRRRHVVVSAYQRVRHGPGGMGSKKLRPAHLQVSRNYFEGAVTY